MSLIVRVANYLLWRYDVPVAKHPGAHKGCIRCDAYARGWLDCATEAAGYDAIRRGVAPDMARLRALRDRYQGAKS